MRKLFTITILLLLVTWAAKGQLFEQADFTAPGPGYLSSYDWVDFNGDGKMDIFEVDPHGDAILHLRNGDGYSSSVLPFEDLYFSEQRWAFYDHDGDGDVDILASNDKSLVILLYSGSGSFLRLETGINFTYPDFGRLHWVDLNGDAKPDIVHGKKIFLNREGSYVEQSEELPEELSNFIFADLNHDGLNDLIAGGYESYEGTTITVRLNRGAALFQSPGVTLPENKLRSATLASVDADGDGDTDIFAIDLYGRGMVFKNEFAQSGQLAFSITQIFENEYLSHTTYGDINGDGKEDLVAASSNAVVILTNTGTAGTISFAKERHSLPLDNLYNLTLIDIDDDNDLDIHLKGYTWLSVENVLFKKTGTPGGTAPAVPTEITTEVTKSVTLSWHDIGALYNVEIIRNGQPYKPSATSSSGKLLVPSLNGLPRRNKVHLFNLPEGSYEWRVQAVAATGRSSAFSATGSFTINPAPTSLTVQVLELTKVRLCWSYNGPGTPTFVIFRKTSSSPAEEIAIVGPGISCYEDLAVPANDAIEYYVVASTAGIYSGPSNIESHHSSYFVATPFGWTDPNIIVARCFPGDFDNDGDYDLQFHGRISHFDNNYLMKNSGNGSFSPHGAILPAESVIAPYLGGPEPLDLDNDGDLDFVVVTGDGYAWQNVTVYLNNNGAFTKSFETPPHLGIAQVVVEDFNSDGRPDILYSHVLGNSSGNPVRYLLLYQTQSGTFIDSKISFTDEKTTTTEFFQCADLNSDGYTDLLWGNPEKSSLDILINQGGTSFTSKTSILPVTYRLGTADFTGDGILDVVLMGNEGLLLYQGTGNAEFSEPRVIALSQYNYGSSFIAADLDLNGWPDIILSDGYNSHIVLNNGSGNLKSSNVRFHNANGSGFAITDIDNDGDIDLFKSGNDSQHQGWNYLYRNQFADIGISNAPPTAPTAITATYSMGKVTMKWNPSTDDHTPTPLLTYNVRVVDSNGKIWLSGEANSDGTFRRKLDKGNAGHSTSKFLNNLPAGTYTCYVQALDASYRISSLSQPTQFTIVPGPTALSIERVTLKKVNLNWNNSNFPETTVIVQRKTPQTNWETIAELPAGASSFIDDRLVYNRFYYYRIIESNLTSTSAISDIVEWNSHFWEIVETDIPNIYGAIDVADYTGDGRMDLIINGGMIYNGYTEDITKATFENTINGWVRHDLSPSDLSYNATIAFADLNGDYRPDIIQHGYIWDVGYKTETFLNNGNKTFSRAENFLTSNAFAVNYQYDFDMDNDLDLEVSRAGTYPLALETFRNEQNGHYLSIATSSCPSCLGIVATADFDGDGDEDIVRHDGSGYAIYLNTPEGFISAYSFSSYENRIAVADVDTDGLPDIILLTSSFYRTGEIYRNLGTQGSLSNLTFSILSDDLSRGDASIVSADFDHDGKNDVVVLSPGITTLLGKDNYSFESYQIPGLRLGLHSASLIDFDNDGDLDILFGGYFNKDFTSDYARKAKVLVNQTIVAGKGVTNTPPNAPSNLKAIQDSLGVHLTWDIPGDDHTTEGGMTYDVILYRDGKIISKGAHDPSTGRRTSLRSGRSTGEAIISNLIPGTYTWRVQAVDGSLAGSPLSSAASFNFLPPPPAAHDTIVYRCGRIVSITAPGENIEWYADKALTQHLASGVFHPTQSQRVYAVQNVNGTKGIPRAVMITILETPAPPTYIYPNPIIFCDHIGSTTLSVEGTGIQWYSDENRTTRVGEGSMISVPVSTSKYYATQTINGCESSPLMITIEVVDMDTRIYYKDGKLHTRAVDGDYYYWTRDGSFHQTTRVPYIPFDGLVAAYSVTVVQGICQKTSPVFVSSEDNITSVEDMDLAPFEVFPNPASQKITITSLRRTGVIKVFDTWGRLAYTIPQGDPGEHIIDTSAWPKGLYLIVADENAKAGKRLVIY